MEREITMDRREDTHVALVQNKRNQTDSVVDSAYTKPGRIPFRSAPAVLNTSQPATPAHMLPPFSQTPPRFHGQRKLAPRIPTGTAQVAAPHAIEVGGPSRHRPVEGCGRMLTTSAEPPGDPCRPHDGGHNGPAHTGPHDTCQVRDTTPEPFLMPLY